MIQAESPKKIDFIYQVVERSQPITRPGLCSITQFPPATLSDHLHTLLQAKRIKRFSINTSHQRGRPQVFYALMTLTDFKSQIKEHAFDVAGRLFPDQIKALDPALIVSPFVPDDLQTLRQLVAEDNKTAQQLRLDIALVKDHAPDYSERDLLTWAIFNQFVSWCRQELNEIALTLEEALYDQH